MGDKWTLLIVRDLLSGPRRFVELQRVLPGISTEQLRSRLNRMVADGMLTRKRYREVPPRVDYELTERSRELAPVLGRLARWGYDWAWSAPRPNERVDVGAIFRLIPGLAADAGVRGSVAMTITDAGPAGPTTHRIVLGPASASITQSDGPADAVIRASTAGWVSAFSPAGARDGLTIDGDRTLAAAVLDLLEPGTAHVVAPASAESAAM